MIGCRALLWRCQRLLLVAGVLSPVAARADVAVDSTLVAFELHRSVGAGDVKGADDLTFTLGGGGPDVWGSVSARIALDEPVNHLEVASGHLGWRSSALGFRGAIFVDENRIWYPSVGLDLVDGGLTGRWDGVQAVVADWSPVPGRHVHGLVGTWAENNRALAIGWAEWSATDATWAVRAGGIHHTQDSTSTIAAGAVNWVTDVVRGTVEAAISSVPGAPAMAFAQIRGLRPLPGLLPGFELRSSWMSVDEGWVNRAGNAPPEREEFRCDAQWSFSSGSFVVSGARASVNDRRPWEGKAVHAIEVESRFSPRPSTHLFARLRRAKDDSRVEFTSEGPHRIRFDRRRLQRDALVELWASGVDVWGRIQGSVDLFDRKRALAVEGGARLTDDIHVLARVILAEAEDEPARTTHFLAFQSRPWDDLWIELEMGRSEPAAFGLLAEDRSLPDEPDLPGSARLVVRGWIHQ